MATDSVLLESSRGRFVGGNSLKHLHKGHGVVAASSSIPSKYQTIVIDNSEKKGFLSRAKRFQDLGPLNDNPGPGTYKMHENPNTDIHASPSYSVRGTGTFASQMSRFNRERRVTDRPGPGEYEPLKPPLKSDFNKAKVTSIFHSPIAATTYDRKQPQAPAPNSYKISKAMGKVVRENNVTANAAFKSSSKRESFITNKNAMNLPSPCQYNINDCLLHKTSSGASSSFKSTTQRTMTCLPQPDLAPGPGSYNPYNAPHGGRKGYKFHRQHYLCISAPALSMPEVEPTPGPGHYNLVNYKGEEKHYMSSSMFVSSTNRWRPGAETEIEIPGPTSYQPRHVGKQSFIYNPTQKWII